MLLGLRAILAFNVNRLFFDWGQLGVVLAVNDLVGRICMLIAVGDTDKFLAYRRLLPTDDWLAFSYRVVLILYFNLLGTNSDIIRSACPILSRCTNRRGPVLLELALVVIALLATFWSYILGALVVLRA